MMENKKETIDTAKLSIKEVEKLKKEDIKLSYTEIIIGTLIKIILDFDIRTEEQLKELLRNKITNENKNTERVHKYQWKKRLIKIMKTIK